MIEHVFYFAYGSNMSVERITERVLSAEKIGVAKLTGYSLKFHKVSNDGSGKCDVLQTNNAENIVYGVLFKLHINDIEKLDYFERRGKGYERISISTALETGEFCDAETYVATNINPVLRPYSWYKEHVMRGAKSNGLPETYISALNTVVADIDPDTDRHMREMSIYK